MIAANEGALGRMEVLLIIEFSHSVATFDGYLDSHRCKKDGKNEHRDQLDLSAVNEGGDGGKCDCVAITPLDREFCAPRKFDAMLIRIDGKTPDADSDR